MYVNHNGYGGRSYPYCSPSSGHDLRGRFLFLQQQQPLLRPGSVVEIGSVRSYCYYSDQPNPLHSNSNYSNPVFFSLDRHVPKPKPKGAAAMRLKAHQSAVVGPDRPAGEADHQLLGPAEGGGGGERRKNSKMVLVELVGAFNEVTQRMLMTNNVHVLSTSSSRLLFQTLKLSIPLLLPLHYHHHHHGLHQPRSSLSKALSVALILADLQMDAEVISAAILREAVEAGAIALKDVGRQIGAPTAHLLHESLRVKSICAKPRVLDALDLGDQSAAAFRKYCLAYYDVRAVILDLAVRLDTMRHDLHHLPRYQQQIFSLQVIRIHAPLAHAVGFGANFLSPELEDMSFRYLFPFSYLYIDSWLSRNHRTAQIDVYRDELLGSLNADLLLSQMVDNISVEGRYKTRYSTMKKLLTDGRRPEQVNDILGLRVILRPTTSGGDEAGLLGERACYRTRKIIQSMWKEIPHRAKDYISRPKANGYKSLHLAVDVSDNGSTVPLMEIQIRTTEMDMLAAGGTASHSLYKGGLTDPEEAKRSKAIMIAAADFAALRLKDVPSSGHKTNHIDPVFSLIDKNDDGKISIEELTEVMEELGGRGEDAREMMQLFDSNSDGSLSSDEFHLFQKQVGMIRNLEGRDDDPFRTLSNEKLQRTESGGLIQTTLLNHILSSQHGRRIAVIENEFGEVDIDGSLVADHSSVSEDIVMISNGCLCCTVRGDLVKMLLKLAKNKRDKFDHIVIETTGLAKPAPVIDVFFSDELVQRYVKLDGVVTLIDSKHAMQHLNEVKPRFVVNEAVEQVAYADRIVLNKIDLVTLTDLEMLTERIKGINGMAQIQKAKFGSVDMDFILGVGGYDLERIEAQVVVDSSHSASHQHESVHGQHHHHHDRKGHLHHHEHDFAVSSVSIVSEGTLDIDEVDDWLQRLVEEKGDDLYRMKGILSVTGSEQRYVFQGVHSVFDGCPGKAWGYEEKRINKLVFVGRNLDEAALRKGFKGCLA